MNEIKIQLNEEKKIELKRIKIEKSIRNIFKKKIEKILLIQPPDLDESKFSIELTLRKRYWNYPPYGPLLVARVAENNGCEVQLLNLQNRFFL